MNRHLLGTLALLGLAVSAAAQDATISKTYSLRLLLDEHEDHAAGQLGFAARRVGAVAQARPVAPGRTVPTAAGVLDALKKSLPRLDWSKIGVDLSGSQLAVTAPRSTHMKIDYVIGRLHQLHLSTIHVDAWLVSMTTGIWNKIFEEEDEIRKKEGTVLLNRAALFKLKAWARKDDAVKLLRVFKLNAFSGQRVAAEFVRTIPYVHELDVVVAAKASRPDPIVGKVREGTSLEVRPFLDLEGTGVLMEVRYQEASVGDWKKTASNGLDIDLPSLALRTVHTTVRIPLETGMIVAKFGHEPSQLLIVRPTLVAHRLDPVHNQYNLGEKTRTRILDLRSLAATIRSFPAAPVDERKRLTGRDEDSEQVRARQLFEAVTRKVGRDVSTDPRGALFLHGRYLVVSQESQVLEGIQKLLKGLEYRRSRQATARLSIRRGDAALLRSLVLQAEDTGRGLISRSEDVAAVKASPAITSVTVTGHDGHGMEVADLVLVRAVTDTDAVVADSVSAAVPIVKTLEVGTRMRLRTKAAGDDGPLAVRLDARHVRAEASGPITGKSVLLSRSIRRDFVAASKGLYILSMSSLAADATGATEMNIFSAQVQE